MQQTNRCLAILFDVPPYNAAAFFGLTECHEISTGQNSEKTIYGRFHKVFDSFENAVEYYQHLKSVNNEIFIDMNRDGTVFIEYQLRRLYLYTGSRAHAYAAHYNYQFETQPAP